MAPRAVEVELGKPGSTVPYAPSDGTLSEGAKTASSSTAAPGVVAVDMESADVKAERDRVSAMTSWESECIVMKDLRKTYPPQVAPCDFVWLRLDVCTVQLRLR